MKTIDQFIEQQRELDNMILESRGLQDKSNKDMINAISCALYSELLEVQQAKKEYTSSTKEGSKEKKKEHLFEEYIDVLHFLLGIGHRLRLEYVFEGVEPRMVLDTEYSKFFTLFESFTELMDGIKAFKFWSNKESESTYALQSRWIRVFNILWCEMVKLGYSDERICEKYDEKYRINIKRQKEGY